MALRDQPYLPLYVMDFMTDEKLNECSAESQGVYMRIMCVMHKSEQYGVITLRAKDKQNDKQILNFANKLVRQMPFDVDTISRALTELIDEGVLTLDGDTLYQKRMVRDGKLSEKRAAAGSKGGKRSSDNKQNASKTASKTQANAENEIENENEDEIEDKDIESADAISPSGTKSSAMQDRFTQFWKAYPRKAGKGAAEKSFLKISPTKELFEQIMAALAAAKMCDQWVKDNGQFVPYPATWLNQRRWEDEYTPSGQKPPRRKKDETPFDWSQKNPFEEWGDSGGG